MSAPSDMRDSGVPAAPHVVVCEGDETGQELLDQALRVLDPEVIGINVDLTRFDLSLPERRRTANGVVHDAAAAMLKTGLGLKAATITPPGADDVGSPNRILREGVGGSVILRTGRRIPGVSPVAPVVHPIAVVRMATGDAYGAEEGRDGDPGSTDERAYRTETITRGSCRQVAEYAFRTAAQMGASVYGGPKWTVSTRYEAMFKEEMDAAAGRHPEVVYRPVLIDAAYAGLLTESGSGPLVVPALNRDGDCLSDLVLALFGSIAGAESVLLSFDSSMGTVVAMAEAPHGTAPSLQGKDVANPMAMLLACATVLDHAGERGHAEARRAAIAIRRATLETAADGIRTFDLGGHASTSGVVDEVVRRVGEDESIGRAARVTGRRPGHKPATGRPGWFRTRRRPPGRPTGCRPASRGRRRRHSRRSSRRRRPASSRRRPGWRSCPRSAPRRGCPAPAPTRDTERCRR